jgi:hypothetical protein
MSDKANRISTRLPIFQQTNQTYFANKSSTSSFLERNLSENKPDVFEFCEILCFARSNS